MTLALIRPTQLYIWKGPSLLVDERGECGKREQLSVLSHQHPTLKYQTHVAPAGTKAWVVGDSSIRTRVEPAPQQMVGLGLRVDPSAADATGQVIPARAACIRARPCIRS